MTFDYSPQLTGIWLIYLRKSRQDDPNQTIEEVLAKHETMLQEHAERELGGRIPEENIYREVVSGESIDERVEIKKVLARIEDPAVLGVLVIEPSRLSRGDLADCARIIDSFRFTHSLVATPMMTYNLENKMERKFFQDELLRGNDYLEYTKEILFRGRVAAAKRGCYTSAIPPYGYNRIKIGRDWTLEPNDDADVVRMVFDWFVKEGLTAGKIAVRLNSMGYTPRKGDWWTRETIYSMLHNIHYTGKVKFNEWKSTWVLENGRRTKKLIKQPAEEIILVEGKHPAIIDAATFEAVKAKAKASNNPTIKHDYKLVNPLAGILRCAKCGRSLLLERDPRRSAEPRYRCRRRGAPSCMKSAKMSDVLNAVLFTLEESELPDLQRKLQNGDGDAAAIQKRRIEKLTKQMAEYREQEDKQYELLETGKYTQDLFDRRNTALREKMEQCENELRLARASMPENVDYAERIAKLQEAIAALKDSDRTPEAKNKILRDIVERIDITLADKDAKEETLLLETTLRF